MLREILRVGPIAIYSYGFMIMLAFAVGIFVTIKRGKKVGIESGNIWDLALLILFTSLAGSRGLYVLAHLEEFRGNWFAVVSPVQPDGSIGMAGMVLLGGVVTGTVAAILFLRWRGMDVWKFADLVAPVLALGICLGRIGCFANGCCYGHPTESFLGVVFPPGSLAGSHFPDTPVLPTQLISSGWALLLFIGLLVAERWKKFDGFTFSLFLIGYSVFRIWVETVRVHEPGEVLIQSETLTITLSQAISVGLIVFGVILFVKLKRKQETKA